MSTSAVQSAQGEIAKASPKKTFQDWVNADTFKMQLAAALPKHLTPDRFVRVLLTATIKTPLLLQCTQETLFNSVFSAAAMGLECDGRRAHLIPFKNNRAGHYECQLIIDYKGLVELAMRSGVVSSIHADVVCENDEFEVDRGQVLKHKIDYRKPRGDAYAAVCIIRLLGGGEKAEVMSREEVLAIKGRSRASGNGPWVTDPGEMWKKTVTRRALKWVPLSAEIREHVEKDDEPINVTDTAKVGLSALVDGVTNAAQFEPSVAAVDGAGDTGGAA